MKKMLKKEEEGAIGIGTLIVFIALILVAAIAAAVIIGTAEDLEERAEDAGTSAENLVQATPQITIAEGTMNAAGLISTVVLNIDLYGTEGVNMQDVVIHVRATPNGGNAVSNDLTMDWTIAGGGATTFDVDEILDPNNQWNPAGTPATFILGQRAQLKITLDLSLCATPLPPDSVLELNMHVLTSGHTTYDLMRTPASYPTGGVVPFES
ncbi:MAG: archaellin/type IV pilin N-terminal domain-containing protein [Thermoplasmatota archaeon]